MESGRAAKVRELHTIISRGGMGMERGVGSAKFKIKKGISSKRAKSHMVCPFILAYFFPKSQGRLGMKLRASLPLAWPARNTHIRAFGSNFDRSLQSVPILKVIFDLVSSPASSHHLLQLSLGSAIVSACLAISHSALLPFLPTAAYRVNLLSLSTTPWKL